ncbi:MAG: endonuclease III [Candidatus Jorgensenbacteria bacterium]|nr:endonuclease III [Candidatus Jorgensenbacteria bacterium]
MVLLSLVARKNRAKKIVAALKRLFPKARVFLNYGTSWELLVAVVLSARCTDKKVNEVTAKLFKKYRKLEDYVRARQVEFEEDIKQTGFYRAKTRNILRAAKLVKEKFGGKIPKTMDEMLEIPGVGRKTANIVLESVHGIVVGIPVDTHVGRLARVLGLSSHTDPKKIESDLMELILEKEWRGISYRFIEYGRKFCPARPHNHAQCPLSRLLKP